MQRSRVKIAYVPAKIWIRNFIRSHAFFVPLIGLLLGMLLWINMGDLPVFKVILGLVLFCLFCYPYWLTHIKKKPDYFLYAKLRFWQIGLLHVLMGIWLFTPKLPCLPADLWTKKQLQFVVVDPLNNWVEVKGGYLCRVSKSKNVELPIWKEGDRYKVPANWVKNYQYSGLPNDVNWPQVMGSLGVCGVVKLYDKKGLKFLNRTDLRLLVSWRFQVLRFCKFRLFGYFENRVAGLLWAMLFGDKSYIDNAYIKQFNTGGLMHALAVSGMHVSLILGVLFWVFSGFGRRSAPSKVILLLVIFAGWFYAAMAGNGAAIIRAVMSASWLWLGRYFFFRKVSALHVWFGTAYFQLLVCPFLIYQAGFVLSYLAVLGLLLLYPIFKDMWINTAWGWLNYLGDAVAMNLSATLFTLPVILGLFHSFPVWFLLGNLLLLPLLSGMVYLSILVLLLGEFGLIGKWCIGLANQSVVLMDRVLGWLERLPLPFLYGYDWHGVTLFLLVIWLALFCFWIWSVQDPKRRWPWRLRREGWLRLVVMGLFFLIGAVYGMAKIRENQRIEFVADFQGRVVRGIKHGDSLQLRVAWKNGDGWRRSWGNERKMVLDTGFQHRIMDKLVVFQRRYGVKVVVFSNVL